MKTLASSCSEILHGSRKDDDMFLSSRNFNGNRLEICGLFFKKSVSSSSNVSFLNLVSVQERGLHPICSSSSLAHGSEADLEPVEAQQPQDIHKSKVHVKFQLQKECLFGEQFFIVGDDPMLGFWDPENAIPLNWSDEHVWEVELDIPIGKPILYKFVLKGKTGDILWQQGPDRVFKPWNTIKTIKVCEDWEKAELQKIVEEEECDITTSSEMLIADNLTCDGLAAIVDDITSPGNLSTKFGAENIEHENSPLQEEIGGDNGRPILMSGLTPFSAKSADVMEDECDIVAAREVKSIDLNEVTSDDVHQEGAEKTVSVKEQQPPDDNDSWVLYNEVLQNDIKSIRKAGEVLLRSIIPKLWHR